MNAGLPKLNKHGFEALLWTAIHVIGAIIQSDEGYTPTSSASIAKSGKDRDSGTYAVGKIAG